MKTLLLTLSMFTLISCGGKMLHWQDGFLDPDGSGSSSGGGNSPSPEQIVETLLPDLDMDTCDTVYPEGTNDGIIAVITCDDGSSYIVDEDGNLIEGDAPTTPGDTPGNNPDGNNNSGDTPGNNPDGNNNSGDTPGNNPDGNTNSGDTPGNNPDGNNNSGDTPGNNPDGNTNSGDTPGNNSDGNNNSGDTPGNNPDGNNNSGDTPGNNPDGNNNSGDTPGNNPDGNDNSEDNSTDGRDPDSDTPGNSEGDGDSSANPGNDQDDSSTEQDDKISCVGEEKYEPGLRTMLVALKSKFINRKQRRSLHSLINGNKLIPIENYMSSEINTAPRTYAYGVVGREGDYIVDPRSGQELLEDYLIRYTGQILIDNAQEEGLYEFALISDDGVLLKISGKSIVKSRKLQAPRFNCAKRYVKLRQGQSRSLQLYYYQGPKHHVANVLLWRKVGDVDAKGSSIIKKCDQERYCGKRIMNVDAALNLGWKVVPKHVFRVVKDECLRNKKDKKRQCKK